MRKGVTISLPEATAKRVDHIVAREGYTSTSELFRDLLRVWDTRGDTLVHGGGNVHKYFRVSQFLRAVKAHTKKGAPKLLSRDHDRYLYGQ